MQPLTYTFHNGELSAALLAGLGNISAERVVRLPAPMTATVADLELLRDPEDCTCELIDGTIVRKASGFADALVVTDVIGAVYGARDCRPQYVVTESRGVMLLREGVGRSASVALTCLSKFPDGRIPSDPIPRVCPNVAIDVIMPANTTLELERKRRDFFLAGTEQYWIVSAKHRTVTIYFPDDAAGVVFHDSDFIDGGLTVPSLRFPVADLFSQYDRFVLGTTT